MGVSDTLLRKIARDNLTAWRASGVVKSVRYYTAEDESVCPECAKRAGSTVPIDEAVIGVNIPPLSTCSNRHCRCYFRPQEISL